MGLWGYYMEKMSIISTILKDLLVYIDANINHDGGSKVMPR